jgi:isopentenyl diphosphate isomerase/L-lactate dehydrogenase-like FMN-dependent dehydrogenase
MLISRTSGSAAIGPTRASGWNGPFYLKGIMTVEDARRAIDIGLDGGRSPFDQLAEVFDAVGDRIDVMMDGGIQRGSHVLKALSLGARAVGGCRFCLFALAVGGQAGVERALALMRTEIERDMRLMGARSVADLSRKNLRFRGAPAPI